MRPMSSLDTLDLVPGDSLGPFQLGKSLYEILSILRSGLSAVPAVEVSWAHGAPHNQPILIHVLKPDLRLLFSATQAQRLVAIELTAPAACLRYKQHQWSVKEGSTAEKTLLRLFGPTYQLSTSPHQPDLDFLCYPGVAFGLTRADNNKGSKELEKVTVTPTGAEGTQDSFSNISDVFDNLLLLNLPPKASGFDEAICNVHPLEAKTPPRVTFTKSGQEPVEVAIGVTHAEDLICDFGQPLRHHFKDDDRLAIHRHNARAPLPRRTSHQSHESQNDHDQSYFMNYFHFGVDFLVSGATHLVQKIILHSHTPGEVLFGRYEHCRWLFPSGSSEGITACSDSNTLVEHLARATGVQEPPPTSSKSSSTPRSKGASKRDPVLEATAGISGPAKTQEHFKLDRTADLADDVLLGKETELVGFPGVVLEVTDTNAVETIWLFDPNAA